MSYTALYRKYRPMSFSDVSGQLPIVAALRNQCASMRVGHAYLFCGTRGTGKTTLAKIMARAVNCLHPTDGDPCNECSACLDILSAKSTDVIEMDAASHNGVDSIRRITDEVNYTPASAKYRVYIIDEAHMLSTGAFNALLKTLEEPPPYCLFILATTEAHKLPVTILSRCQRYDFWRLTKEQIADRVRYIASCESFHISDRAVSEIAGFAGGALRDALSILERCVTTDAKGEIGAELVRSIVGAGDIAIYGDILNAVFEEDVTGLLSIFDKALSQGLEPLRFADDFNEYLRNCLLIKEATSASNAADFQSALEESTLTNIIDLTDEQMLYAANIVSNISADSLMRYLHVISALPAKLRYSQSKRILCEVDLIKLCKPEMETDHISVLERVRVLETAVDKIKDAAYNANPAPVYVSQPSMPPVQNTQRAYTPIERSLLEKALPEDIKSVYKEWSNLILAYGRQSKAAAEFAKKATLGIDKNNCLTMTYGDDDTMAAEYFSNVAHLNELQTFIQERTKKSIVLKIIEGKKNIDTGDESLLLSNVMITVPIEFE